jgi:hypothetical protein
MVEKVVPRMGLLFLAIVEGRRDQRRHGYSRVLDQHCIRNFSDDGVSEYLNYITPAAAIDSSSQLSCPCEGSRYSSSKLLSQYKSTPPPPQLNWAGHRSQTGLQSSGSE